MDPDIEKDFQRNIVMILSLNEMKYTYSKECVKWPLKNKRKDLNDKWELNTSQKY